MIQDDALTLLDRIGVRKGNGYWAVPDPEKTSCAYIHHSTMPTALCAYAVVDPGFAKKRLPSYKLTDLAHKIPSMDWVELSALAMVCVAPAPGNSYEACANALGLAVWYIVHTYELDACFERVERPYGDAGEHYCLRPRGFDWATGGDTPLPDVLRAMRKAYRAMDPLRQVMVLSILHLYLSRDDKHFLLGGCPTKIHAADAVAILHDHGGTALADWGRMLSNYSAW